MKKMKLFCCLLVATLAVSLTAPALTPVFSATTVEAKAKTKAKSKSKVKVEISQKRVKLTAGSTLQLSVKGTSSKVTWKSNKKSVATVDANGLVTAVKAGEAKITATIGKKKYVCEVKVLSGAAQSIKLSESTLTIVVDDAEKLVAKILPYKATSSTITWTSSNTSVARVTKSGVVIAVGIGTATITATTANGLKATCEVVVIEDSTVSGNATE